MNSYLRTFFHCLIKNISRIKEDHRIMSHGYRYFSGDKVRDVVYFCSCGHLNERFEGKNKLEMDEYFK